MFAHITSLRYWKSEHDEETCEDARGQDAASGLFAVADGAGTTLFSNIWAHILVEHFLSVPLLSNDPFEVEWWVRQAQKQFEQQAPQPDMLQWNAFQKAQSQGSHATLATLRITESGATEALAELLVFGDSCVLIGKANERRVLSFPLDNPADFERAPICIPTRPSIFNRYFHRAHMMRETLSAGDLVVLATDAVAKWIVSAGAGHYTGPLDALHEVSRQTPETWPAFIEECRDQKGMLDDDSTALVLALQANASENAVELGTTREHAAAIREQRSRNLGQALGADNKELAAFYIGDGVDLSQEVGIQLCWEQIQHYRRVADAMREVLQVLRQEVSRPGGAAKVEAIWQQHAALLQDEVCAKNVRQTLTRMGIAVMPPVPSPALVEGSAPAAPEVDALSSAGDQQATASAEPPDTRPLYTENIVLSEQHQQMAADARQQQIEQSAEHDTERQDQEAPESQLEEMKSEDARGRSLFSKLIRRREA
jgi:hypothetical protein